ncbi:MAG: hypothetical protein SOW08_09465 [Lachnospiraceae bacterium]|nr:hypothetical protein [Lachnospiraceae bacterium]
MKRYLLAVWISVIVFLSGCGNTGNSIAHSDISDASMRESELEEELDVIIIENLKGCVSAGDITSGNPFDYMDNEYYANIKDLGENAIPVLLEGHQDGQYNGLIDYIAMYLVWDISGNTDAEALEECETADQMYDAWMQFPVQQK